MGGNNRVGSKIRINEKRQAENRKMEKKKKKKGRDKRAKEDNCGCSLVVVVCSPCFGRM